MKFVGRAHRWTIGPLFGSVVLSSRFFVSRQMLSAIRSAAIEKPGDIYSLEVIGIVVRCGSLAWQPRSKCFGNKSVVDPDPNRRMISVFLKSPTSQTANSSLRCTIPSSKGESPLIIYLRGGVPARRGLRSLLT